MTTDSAARQRTLLGDGLGHAGAVLHRPRGWSVESANAALPAVGALIESVRASVERHRDLLDPTAPRELPGIDPRITAAGAAGALAAEGIALRDVERGLVDFSAVSPSGRPYWLCWVVGEEKVQWWHWVEDGFAGRTPISQPPV